MKKILFIILSILFIISSCSEVNNPSPIVPSDTPWCKVGCEHLQHLTGKDGQIGCEESRSLELPGGDMITCEQFCTETQNSGRNLYPSCWATAKSCNELEQFRKRSLPCEAH
jgi:hypothetical protein